MADILYYKDEEDLKHLKTDVIDRFHVYIEYLGFKHVIMDIRNRYINATKLCKEDGKRFDNWLANESSKELIQELYFQLNSSYEIAFPSTGNTVDGSTVFTPTTLLTGGNNVELRGTYVHPLLLPNILSWLSPKFALRVGKIVNMYAIKEKQDKIFSLEKMHKDLTDQNKQILTQLEIANQQLEDSNAINERNEEKIDRLTVGIKSLSVKKLDPKQYCSKPLNRNVEEILVISKVNIILNSKSISIVIVNRCQRRSYKLLRDRMLKRILNKPEYRGYVKQEKFIVPQLILEAPNVVGLWATFKFNNDANIQVLNGIITKKNPEFRVIDELCKHSNVEKKPMAQLQKEYDELLAMKDEDETTEFD